MRMNANSRWRALLDSDEPDLHLKDVEILLRIFAMLIDAQNYSPSMVKFLNQFSRKCQTHDGARNEYLESLFDSFLKATGHLPGDAFLNKSTNRFSIALIEAVFTASCSKAFEEKRTVEGRLDADALSALKADTEFLEAASSATTQTINVQARLERGRQFIEAL